MRAPSSTSGLISLRGAGLLLVAGVLAISATACGGDGGITANNKLTIGFAGSGRGTVTGSPGSINCTNASGSPTGTCEADIGDGAQVTLSATAEAGSTFTGWSGDGATCGANTPCAMTISESRNVIATFEGAAATQTLTIAGGGAGTGSGHIVSDPAGIDCTISSGTADASCSGSFPTGSSVQLQVQSGSLVGWGGACSGLTCAVVMSGPQNVIATFTPDAPATQLGFVGQPSATQVGTTMAPVQVAVQDAARQTVAGRTDAITLRIGANPGNATLGGTLTRNAESGVATFTDLTLDQIGTGYTITASASGFPDVTSEPFNVTTGTVAQLAFTVPPAATTPAGVAINPAVQVTIQDPLGGGVLTDRTDQITISLGSNPAGGALGGTKTVTAVAGVATFSNLTVQKAGTGYTLAARAQNARGATSSAFAIVAGSARQLAINSVQSQQAPVSTAVPVRPSVKVMDAFNNPVEGVPVTWEVTVPAGGGSVVASQPDPVVRPTGPLGLSTVVSWTLGSEVGTQNNELRASATGLNGSPVTFKASGTLPPGQSAFIGVLSEISNVGFPPNPVAIPNASLSFFNLTTQTPAGKSTSKADGSFVSPPLPSGDEYRIDVSATDYKDITYQRPSLPAAPSSLGRLGMVPFSTGQGTAGIDISIQLKNPPANSVHVRLDVFSGYYVGETVDNLIINTFEGDTEVETGAVGGGINPLADWGVLTVRVSAPGYETQDKFVFVDKPTTSVPVDITLEPSPAE